MLCCVPPVCVSIEPHAKGCVQGHTIISKTTSRVVAKRNEHEHSLKCLIAVLMLLVAGCDSASDVSRSESVRPSIVRLNGDHATLRVRTDRVRERVWVLGLKRVEVYDKRTSSLIRRIDLPPWSVADFVCEPDIAFDRKGAAFISHNLEPRIWEIDPDTFELKEHVLRLVGKERLDIGFGRLAFTQDGAFFGVASTGGSLWRIDLASATARAVDASAPRDECSGR
jgi:hypothetical protein